VYPLDLAPRGYRIISPFLPLTHAVHGLRAAMFGSYDGEWARQILYLLPWILISVSLSFVFKRRFRYVDDNAYGPALDLSFRKTH
jgi:putative membrane protein